MKIRLVEIEANAKELQAGNTLADNFSNLLSSCFRQPIPDFVCLERKRLKTLIPDLKLASLTELQSHGRLIDADALIERAWRLKLDTRELIVEMINSAPTIIEAEVE